MSDFRRRLYKIGTERCLNSTNCSLYKKTDSSLSRASAYDKHDKHCTV